METRWSKRKVLRYSGTPLMYVILEAAYYRNSTYYRDSTYYRGIIGTIFNRKINITEMLLFLKQRLAL